MNETTDMPRPVTTDLLVQFVAWTRTADMFLSSPQGAAFGEELRDVFKLAAERLGQMANEQQTTIKPTVAELFSARDQIASDRRCDRREECAVSSVLFRDCACMQSAALRWHREGDVTYG